MAILIALCVEFLEFQHTKRHFLAAIVFNFLPECGVEMIVDERVLMIELAERLAIVIGEWGVFVVLFIEFRTCPTTVQ